MSFHDTFNLWLKDYVGHTVIKSYQGQNRPTLPYLMTNLTDRLLLTQQPKDVIGRDYAEGEPGESEIEIVMDHEYRVSVHAYGSDPLGILAPIMAAKNHIQATWPLLPYKIHEIGRASFVPELIQNVWEPRAVLRLTCHGTHRDTRPGDVAETIEDINIEAES